MSSLSSILEQIRGFDLERAVGLRPPCPEVALELDRTSMTLVRLKSKRRGVRSLEAFKIQSVDDGTVPATMIDPRVVDSEELAGRLRDLFEAAGARPGRVSVVLPDNLAKISLLTLPERPPSRKQLEELVRFKLRRAVPFRMHETVLSYQLIPGEGKSLSILVALVQRNLIERYEQALEAIGAKPGLIDLCTPSILNLCRAQLETDGSDADVAAQVEIHLAA